MPLARMAMYQQGIEIYIASLLQIHVEEIGTNLTMKPNLLGRKMFCFLGCQKPILLH